MYNTLGKLLRRADLACERQHKPFDDRRISVSDSDVKTCLIAILVGLILSQHEVTVTSAEQKVYDS